MDIKLILAFYDCYHEFNIGFFLKGSPDPSVAMVTNVNAWFTVYRKIIVYLNIICILSSIFPNYQF